MSKRVRWIVGTLVGLVVVWTLGDLIYSRIVQSHWQTWESQIEREPSGVRVGCEAYGVGEGEHALLLIHGINDSPRIYDQMAPVLAEAGFHCRVMRLPGFAMPMEAYAQSTVDLWLESVDDELSRLRKDHRQVSVIAHSLGGAIAVAHLYEHPDQADHVVLLAPAMDVSSRRSPLLSPRAWHELADRTLLFTWLTESPFNDDTHDPAMAVYPWRTPFTPRSIFGQTYEVLDRNAARDPKGFRVPLLMVLSRDDQVIDWEAAEQFYDNAGANPKELFFCEDSGHAIPRDFDWRTVTDRAIRFLGKG